MSRSNTFLQDNSNISTLVAVDEVYFRDRKLEFTVKSEDLDEITVIWGIPDTDRRVIQRFLLKENKFYPSRCIDNFTLWESLKDIRKARYYIQSQISNLTDDQFKSYEDMDDFFFKIYKGLRCRV